MTQLLGNSTFPLLDYATQRGRYSFVPNCRGGRGRIKCTRGELSRFLKMGGVFLERAREVVTL